MAATRKLPTEQGKKTWTSLFASHTSPNSGAKLHYEPPTMEGSRLIISATPEELDEGRSHWQNALVGYFVGSKPPYHIVKARAEAMWKPTGGMEILTLPAGFYIFRFALAEDKNRALEGGPWFIQNRLLLLKPWDQNTTLQKINLAAIPVWVKIHDVPLEMWTPTLISRIASGVGVPLHMDHATTTKTRINYARVCVEIPADKQMPDQIELSVNGKPDCILRLEYDRRPPRCSQCCIFGHSDTHCPVQTVKGKAVWIPKQSCTTGTEQINRPVQDNNAPAAVSTEPAQEKNSTETAPKTVTPADDQPSTGPVQPPAKPPPSARQHIQEETSTGKGHSPTTKQKGKLIQQQGNQPITISNSFQSLANDTVTEEQGPCDQAEPSNGAGHKPPDPPN